MKRIIAIALVAVMVFSLAACGGKKETEAPQPESQTEENVGIANPWTEAKTAEEAAEGAGVGNFNVPEDKTETKAGEIVWSAFRYMEGIAEAEGLIGSAELTVRKGLKQEYEDVSGDYTEYAHEWTQELGDLKINCFGNEEGKTMKAVWVTDNFSYSIMVRGQGDEYETYGIEADALEALAGAIE